MSEENKNQNKDPKSRPEGTKNQETDLIKGHIGDSEKVNEQLRKAAEITPRPPKDKPSGSSGSKDEK